MVAVFFSTHGPELGKEELGSDEVSSSRNKTVIGLVHILQLGRRMLARSNNLDHIPQSIVEVKNAYLL